MGRAQVGCWAGYMISTYVCADVVCAALRCWLRCKLKKNGRLDRRAMLNCGISWDQRVTYAQQSLRDMQTETKRKKSFSEFSADWARAELG